MGRPEKTFKCGNVDAAIFEKTWEGKISYSLKLQKSYKDMKSGEWKTSEYFSEADMGNLKRVVDMASMKMYGLKESAKNSNPAIAQKVFNQPVQPQQSDSGYTDDVPF